MSMASYWPAVNAAAKSAPSERQRLVSGNSKPDMARKPYTKKRAAYLKKRARQFAEQPQPVAMKPHYRRYYQPLVHQGRLSDAQCRALGSIVDDLF